ncbi:hypothetical protein K490DRAFT_53685 [Saccharata proteae CBS 121410]|uniref:Uncharacterized protein n=1 Tax=Saccharata proteae CBS 121410 TaxID=1314787 RepID=A0A9P4HZF9_9PEZI|nr:hypothetical protein K490DRAFT_53685 [Saccharata proteae CBS 121410]
MFTAKPSCCAALRVFARRNFATSASLQRTSHLPTFAECSNPELTKILDEVRMRTLLPKYLDKSQSHLVQSPEAQRLINDPAYARIGTEDVRLLPNSIEDRPGARSSFLHALNLAETREDWDNMEKLLEGYNNARYHTRMHQVKKAFVVLGCSKGYHDIVLRCLQRVEATGLSLRDDELLLQALLGFRAMAAEADWDAAVLEKALSYVEQTIELMEMEGHCGGKSVHEGDPRTAPFAMGVPLELAVRRASVPEGWENEGGRIKVYADRLTAVIERYGPMPSLKGDISMYGQKIFPSTRLKRTIPVYNGLKLAQEFLGSDMPRDGVATSAIAQLKTEIDKAEEEYVPKNPLAGQSQTSIFTSDMQ